MNSTRENPSPPPDPFEIPLTRERTPTRRRRAILIRVAVVAVILLIGVGIAWYVLRDSRESRVKRWRAATERFFNEGNYALAKRFNERILELAPESPPDLLVKARIAEGQSTREGWLEALATYERILEKVGPRAAGINYYKSRVCHALGRLEEARGLALSVLDAYPFEATIQLGRLAADRMDPRRALELYQQALDEYAKDDEDRALAWDAIETTCSQLILLAESRGSASRSLAEKTLDQLRELQAKALERERRILVGFLDERRSIDAYGPWLAHVALRLAAIRPGEGTPCLDAGRKLEAILDSPTVRAATRPETLFRVGSLLLEAIWRGELERASDLRGDTGEKLRERAFNHLAATFADVPPEAARDLLSQGLVEDGDLARAATDSQQDASTDRREKARTYVTRLSDLSRLFLDSPEHTRILDDDSVLDLDRRIEAGLEAADPEVAGIFGVVRGLEYLRSGDEARARESLDGYVGAPGRDPLRASLAVAREVADLAPGSELVGVYLDRIEKEADSPFDELGARVHLLLRLARLPDETSAPSEPSRRLDSLLASAEKVATSPDNALAIVKLTHELRGDTAAMEALERGVRRFPKDENLRSLYSQALVDRGRELLESGKTEKALENLSRALDGTLRLFVESPLASTEVTQRTRELANFLLSREDSRDALERAVSNVFSGAPGPERKKLALALAGFAAGRWEKAGREAEEVGAALDPFAAWLTGTCYLQAAAVGELSTSEESRETKDDPLDRATRAFERAPNALACRVGLARAALARLAAGEDVPDPLLDEVRRLAAKDGIEHHGHWLHSVALFRRLEARASDPATTEAELADLLARTRLALRRAIEKQPENATTWIRLSDTWVLPDVLSNVPSTRTFTPDRERAVLTLRAAPEPDLAIVDRIARHLVRLGKSDAAVPYIAALALVAPDAGTLERFVRQSLAASGGADARALEILLDPQATLPSLDDRSESALGELENALDRSLRASSIRGLVDALRSTAGRLEGPTKNATFRLLRERLSRVPHHEAVRHELLAILLAQNLDSGAAGRGTREALVRHLRAARDEWQEAGQIVPIPLLNNLAWHLVEGDDPAERAEGLEVAKALIDRVADPASLPAAHDTYGWALFRNGEIDRAKEVLAGLTERFPEPEFRIHLARVLEAKGESAEALREVEAAFASGLTADTEARALRNRLRGAVGSSSLEEIRTGTSEASSRPDASEPETPGESGSESESRSAPEN